MTYRPRWDNQFRETEYEKNRRLARAREARAASEKDDAELNAICDAREGMPSVAVKLEDL